MLSLEMMQLSKKELLKKDPTQKQTFILQLMLED
jgi:hypothetical protein